MLYAPRVTLREVNITFYQRTLLGTSANQKIHYLKSYNKCSLTYFLCSNISAVPAYGIYISQLMRYTRACGSYQDIFDRELLLTRKLLNQGFLLVQLKSSLRKFYGRHHDSVDRYGISVLQMTTDMFHL